MAKFYGIGTGPGDSSLVTVKALDTLQNIRYIIYTRIQKRWRKFSIINSEEYIPDNVEIKSRHFPMN